MSDDTEPLTVRMAQNNVTEPELYRQAQELERDRELARLEAKHKRDSDQSLAARVIEELVSSLDPGDLVPLVRLVTEAVTETRQRNDSVNGTGAGAPAQNQTEQESPAKRMAGK